MNNTDNKTGGTAKKQNAVLQNRLERIKNRNQIAKSGKNTIRQNSATAYQPFPLNDMQQAYWLGRDAYFEEGDMPMHYYIELQGNAISVFHLEKAWQRLIERHPSLRSVVLADGRQQVLRHVEPYSIQVNDLRQLDDEAREQALLATRDRLSHYNADLTVWPQHIIECSQLPSAIRIHISIDLWCVDGRSLQILFEELGQLYNDPDIVLPEFGLTFRDYILFQEEFEKTPTWQKAFAYWQNRLEKLPPAPPLPMNKANKANTNIDNAFNRQQGVLSNEETKFVQEKAKYCGTSLACVMAAIYAETLGLFSSNDHFSLNIPHFNRPAVHPEINAIIGEFASFTLLEVDLGERLTFIDRVKQLQQRLWQDLEHSQVSGVRILREIAKNRPNTSGAMMPVVFTTAPERVIDGKRSELEEMLASLGDVVFNLSQTPQVWIDCQYFELNGAIHYNWDAIEELFAPGLLEAMFSVYSKVLHRLANEESAWESENLFQLPEEQFKRRQSVNQTHADYDYIDPWRQLVNVATTSPEHKAVITTSDELTYQELVQKSACLAKVLSDAGVIPNSRVALFLPKGMEQPVAVMAVMALGAAYVPLDISWSASKLQSILTDCAPDALIYSPTQIYASELNCPTIECDLQSTVMESSDRINWPGGSGEASPAYLIYTSGSTGEPKGVIITRGNLSNLLNYSNRYFNMGSDDVIYGVTGLHHDLSVYDLFGAFSSGACLVLPERGYEKDPFHWLSCLHYNQCTFWNSVPMSMEMLLEASRLGNQGYPQSLRHIVLGGDWVPIDLPSKLIAANTSLQITTIGGPTETTVWNIMHAANNVSQEAPSIPYGKPIANCGYHILDKQLRHCPDGVIGQMYCFGSCVADGYWNRPEQTKKSFFIHPETGQRLYATGDTGLYLPDGSIQFIGRIDSQINFNGYRVAAAELETILSEYPAITKVIVLLKNEPEPYLAAFIQLAEHEEFDLEDFLCFSQDNMPGQLRLGAVEIVADFPVNENGKIDRQQLSLCEIEYLSQKRHVEAATSPLEMSLLKMWEDLLKQPQNNVRAPFWEMGANSLHAAQFIAAIKNKLDIHIAFGTFFSVPSVRELANLIVQQLQATHDITREGNA